MCDQYISPEPTDDEFTNGVNAWNAQADHIEAHNVEPDALIFVAEMSQIIDKFGALFQGMPITQETRALANDTANDTVIPFIKGMLSAFDERTVRGTTVPDTIPESWL